jgi:hypothetical protein
MAEVTATSLCTAVLRKLRAIDPDETPNATELDNVFTEFKRMAKTWAAKSLPIYASNEISMTLTNGRKFYYISTSYPIDEAFQSSRPIGLASGCYVNYAGRDYPLDIIGRDEYKYISEKDSGLSSVPSKIWYDPQYADPIVYVWPPGSGTMYLQVLDYLSEPANIDSNVEYPDEYQDAIVWNLACRVSPEFVGDPSPYMLAMAAYTMEALENINAANDPPESEMDIRMIAPDYTMYDIDSG